MRVGSHAASNLVRYPEMKAFIAAGALALALATTATAAEYKVGDITVVDPWARATAGVPRNGAAYLTIKGGAIGDELVSVETENAMHAQLHGNKMENNVMIMFKVDGLEVPANAMTMLKPGGYHIMLMKLKHALKKGESFPMTLHFAKAGKVTVEVNIMGVGAKGNSHDHSKMKMKMKE